MACEIVYGVHMDTTEGFMLATASLKAAVTGVCKVLVEEEEKI